MAYTDSYGVKFSNDQEVLIKCPDNFEGSYIIPDSVTKIDRDAFSGCSGLTSIVIPDSVTEIGSGAFQGCSNLTNISIPNSVTKISDDVFLDCQYFTIFIPNETTIMFIHSCLRNY